MDRWLYLPDSAIGDLELLSNLESTRVAALVGILDADYQKEKYELALDVGRMLGITDQAAVGFLTFWEYVQREQRSAQKSADEVIKEFVAFLESHPDSKHKALADAIASKQGLLQEFFGDFPRRDLGRRVRRLETGPLPHVHAVESVCDIRPVFEREGEHISRFFPLVTMRIAYHDACDEHRELVVQLTEESIRMFEEDLARIRRRLEVLRGSIADLSLQKPSTANPRREG